MKKEKQTIIFFLSLVLVLQLFIYAPHVGKGFVTDDFVWLGNVIFHGSVDYLKPFSITPGFYRPLVSLTFGLQYQLHGLDPGPYGWFNLILHLVNILLVYRLLSSIEISRAYALPVAILFAFNTKGPAMAVGWISGRTTLLFTLFTLLSLYLYLKAKQQAPQHPRRLFLYVLAAMTYLAALLSKETAVAVPVFVFLASFFIRGKKDKRIQTAFQSMLVFLIPLVFYGFLRLSSNAITPFNAPDFYRFTLAPTVILRNLWEYITRAGMLDFSIAVWLLVVLLFTRKRIKTMEAIDRTLLAAGAGWFLCFLLPTLFVPVRSDIYVYVPQVGLHLMLLPIIFYLWRQTVSSIKKRINRVIVLFPIGVLILVCIGFLMAAAEANAKKGNSSAVFTRQVVQAASTMEVETYIFIVDTHANQGLSPSRTVSYGFPWLLHLYYPDKYFTGEIILPRRVSQIKCKEGIFNFFFRANGELVGPFNCAGLRYLITLSNPYISSLEKHQKQEKPGSKRPHSLKKRKLRLKRLKLKRKV
jgi:hypothetical protein